MRTRKVEFEIRRIFVGVPSSAGSEEDTMNHTGMTLDYISFTLHTDSVRTWMGEFADQFDVEESAKALRDLLAERLSSAYPSAEIHIDIEHGAGYDALSTHPADDPHVPNLIDDIWADDSWLVKKASDES